MSTSVQPQPAYPYAPPPAPSSKQRRSPYERPRGGASPPPIATLPTHSGSPSPSAVSSLDRSNVSTPPVGSISASGAGRRSPPGPPQHQQGAPQQQQHYSAYEMPRGYTGGYMYAPPPPPPAQYHPHPDDRSHPAHYGDHPPAQYAPQPFPIAHGGYVPYPLPGTILSAPMAPPQGGGPGGGSVIQVVHTDDAATKLSDRVRRRCFNCCTTDTSTWRRSNLSPGKVLCNKCGLFERTHSRPRPEQFPHKRGPLASSTLRSRSPQQTQATYQASPQCPPPGFLGFTLPPVSPSSYREVLESENPRNDLERQAPFNPEVIDMDECPIALSLCEVSETTVGGPKLEGGQTTVVDVASQNDGTTQQIPESGDPSQTLPLSSPMALEEVPGTRLDTANISTFIIWSPKSAPDNSQTSALSPEDLQTLKDEFAEGGTIVSVHSPDNVILWLEANHDHPLLQKMRAHGVGGPIAAMLSPEEPSLVVFGSIRDSWIVDAAEVLSKLSNFAVMIRPLRDNPVPNWENSLGGDHDQGSGHNQAQDSLSDNGNDRMSMDQDDDDMDVESENGSTTTKDNVELSDQSGQIRLRGGASRDSNGPWMGPLHTVDVLLNIYPREGVSYNVDLLTRIQFQTQSKYESKHQHDNVVSYEGRRPQIISKMQFSVVPREGAPVKADRSYSTVGFLVEKQKITDCRWLECPDFLQPRQTAKKVDTETKAKTSTLTAMLSPHPVGTLSYATTSTKTTASENQNDKVTPKCRLEFWAGKRLKKNEMFYDSFEIAYEAEDDLNKQDGTKYPMEVEFSMGINVADLPNKADDHLPHTSFLILNQTNLWIYRSDLRSKSQGILVLTVAHIPDITTFNELYVIEDQTLKLVDNSILNVPTDTVPMNDPVNISLSISRIQELKPDPKPQQLWKKLKYAAQTVVPQKIGPLKPQIQSLPLHEFISRGWDARLDEWRKVMYPSLTSAFQRVSKHSDIAAWRLDVGDFTKGEQRDPGEPRTYEDLDLVPSDTSFTTGSDLGPGSQSAIGVTTSTPNTSEPDTAAGAKAITEKQGEMIVDP